MDLFDIVISILCLGFIALIVVLILSACGVLGFESSPTTPNIVFVPFPILK